MTINEFIRECATLDSPIGDLANDILKDPDFPSDISENEIFNYLRDQTLRKGTFDTFQEFLIEYQKIKNETLIFILTYLKKNSINSIETAVNKKIAMPYTELCGYLIKIPVENEFPKNLIKDLRELETLNEKLVPISDGNELRSYLITSPNINDGTNITFCSQEVQLEYLILLSREE